MNTSALFKSAEKFVEDNSPAILSAIAVIGTGATAYLAARGGIKAQKLIQEDHTKQMLTTPAPAKPDESFGHKVKVTWTQFLPAAATSGLTIACIICANRISTRRAAAMAVAYVASEKKFNEYKKKITEKLGAVKEQKVADEIAQDQVNQTPQRDNLIIVGGDSLCFDSYTGRYFKSSIEDIKQAQNDLNYEMLHNEFASLNDFYRKIGLPVIKIGEEVGWTRNHLLEVTYSTVLADNNEPCIVLNYGTLPVRGYDVSAC